MSKKVYSPEFEVSEKDIEAFSDFLAIIRQLRRDCPWDREQSHESVKHLLIEEAYETVQAIDNHDWEELKKELGDLLLHVIFHCTMAEQTGHFTLQQVIESESEKLIRRHPHVFGDVKVAGVSEVLTNWEQIKMQEKERQSALQGVPGNMPALLRAHRVQEKASSVGFDFPEKESAWDKVEEEISEFKHVVEAGAASNDIENEFGDLLFALVNYARFVNVNPENALRLTNDKFTRRFRYIEDRLAENGKSMSQVDLHEMDRYWDEAKKLE